MGLLDRLGLRRRKPGGAKLTSPDGLPVVELPAAYVADLRLYGLRSSYGHMYRTQPNVRAVVDFLAREHAGIKLKLFERVPTSPTQPTGRLELDEHQLQLVLNRPSPGVTRYRLWKATTSDIAIYDVAYWQKFRVRGQVQAVVRVPPDALFPDRDPLTKRIRRYLTTDGGRIELRDLVVFIGYDPEQAEGSVSPLETLRRTLSEEYASGRNREFMWRNAVRKSGVVERPLEAPPWNFEAREAWRADFESVASGETNAGRVALLEDGMQWKDVSWSPREMEYLAGRELTRKECAAAWGVDPRLVFATDSPIDKETRTSFYVDRLSPSLTALAEEVDVQLLPDFEPFPSRQARIYGEFNLDEKLRGSFEEQAKIASSAVGGPYVTVNEMRARVNLPPVEGGDKIFIPLNSTRAGGPQGSPQAPVDTPGDGPAPGETPGGGTEPDDEEKREAARRYAAVLRRHMDRQHRSLRSLAGAGVEGKDALDSERWNRELAADLREAGLDKAQAERAAARVNATTMEAAGDLDALERVLRADSGRAETLGALLAYSGTIE